MSIPTMPSSSELGGAEYESPPTNTGVTLESILFNAVARGEEGTLTIPKSMGSIAAAEQAHVESGQLKSVLVTPKNNSFRY